MTREEINEVIKVMSAYVNGKKIQYLNDDGRWVDTPNPLFDWSRWEYRIKPEPNYRPFKNAEECWNEMLKHQPFGLVKEISTEMLYLINGMTNTSIVTMENINSFEEAINIYKFKDGEPFGINED